VFRQLDAGQAEQVVNQAVHPLRLVRHDPQEPRLSRRVVGSRAAQGVNKADQAGQRRAQLVAGVGHEVGPHPLHGTLPGAVGHDGDDAPAIGQGRVQGHDRRIDLPRHGHRQAEFGCLVLALAGRAVNGGAQPGVAQHRRHLAAEGAAGGGVGPADLPVGTQHDQRVGQALDDGSLGLQQPGNLGFPRGEVP